MYSSVHRGAGYRSRQSTAAYEAGPRQPRWPSPGARPRRRRRGHLLPQHHRGDQPPRLPAAARARRRRGDHGRRAPRQPAAVGPALPSAATSSAALDGTFTTDDVVAALDDGTPPAAPRHHRRLERHRAGAPDSTRSSPPPTTRGVPVLVDAAQLAPHRPLPATPTTSPGAGTRCTPPSAPACSSGRARRFADGDPFLAGGGAVDLVDLDEVVWTDPPDREEAGSPNVVGAVALDAAIDELDRHRLGRHRRPRRRTSRAALHDGLGGHPRRPAARARPRPTPSPSPPSSLEGVPHALVAARLSAEHGIGVRHGCFCAHPYLLRLLGLSPPPRSPPTGTPCWRATAARSRAPCGPAPASPPPPTTSTGSSPPSPTIARRPDPPVAYDQDPGTGDYWPRTDTTGWTADDRHHTAPCGRG